MDRGVATGVSYSLEQTEQQYGQEPFRSVDVYSRQWAYSVVTTS